MTTNDWGLLRPSMYCGGMFQYGKLIGKGGQKDYRRVH